MQAERTFAPYLRECVLRSLYFEGKFNAGCLECRLKVIHPRELAMPLMNPGNLFVSNPSLVCHSDFGLYPDLVQRLKSVQHKCVFINPISPSSKEFGVSMIVI